MSFDIVNHDSLVEQVVKEFVSLRIDLDFYGGLIDHLNDLISEYSGRIYVLSADRLQLLGVRSVDVFNEFPDLTSSRQLKRLLIDVLGFSLFDSGRPSVSFKALSTHVDDELILVVYDFKRLLRLRKLLERLRSSCDDGGFVDLIWELKSLFKIPGVGFNLDLLLGLDVFDVMGLVFEQELDFRPLYLGELRYVDFRFIDLYVLSLWVKDSKLAEFMFDDYVSLLFDEFFGDIAVEADKSLLVRIVLIVLYGADKFDLFLQLRHFGFDLLDVEFIYNNAVLFFGDVFVYLENKRSYFREVGGVIDFGGRFIGVPELYDLDAVVAESSLKFILSRFLRGSVSYLLTKYLIDLHNFGVDLVGLTGYSVLFYNSDIDFPLQIYDFDFGGRLVEY